MATFVSNRRVVQKRSFSESVVACIRKRLNTFKILNRFFLLLTPHQALCRGSFSVPGHLDGTFTKAPRP